MSHSTELMNGQSSVRWRSATAADGPVKMTDDNETSVRRGDDNADTPADQRRDGGGGQVRARRGRAHLGKVRYTGACGYYICYSIFVSVVGLTLLGVILALHLARCLLQQHVDTSVYQCFVELRLGPQPRHSRYQ